jgi:hypothetical protein
MPYASPDYLIQRYQNLYVRVSASEFSGPYRATQYRNARHGSKPTGTKAGLQKKDAILGALCWKYKQITGREHSGENIQVPPEHQSKWYAVFRNRPINKVSLVRAFNGKGSPEEMELALEAALATGQVQREDLYAFCHQYMGLDCNGFVGNYARANGMMKSDGHLGPSTGPDVYALRGEMRTRIEEIRKGDTLIWPGESEHVAIVSFSYGYGAVEVCESAKSLGGLSQRCYQFTGRTSTGKTMVEGRREGTMLEAKRPSASGGSYTQWLLVTGVGL